MTTGNLIDEGDSGKRETGCYLTETLTKKRTVNGSAEWQTKNTSEKNKGREFSSRIPEISSTGSHYLRKANELRR